MKILITGGCGFLGSNLTQYSISSGHQVTVFDNLSRFGSALNLQWLESLGAFKFIHGDIRSYDDVVHAVKVTQPDVVFHLAGQVAMTTSIERPRLDTEINILGGSNVLEAVRVFSPKSIVTYSSTNKVYGELEYFDFIEKETRFEVRDFPNGFDENVRLDFRSPYGVSKGSIDQMMLDYYRIFGVKTVVFRHSSIFGERQFSTSDQGWIGWFISCALNKKKNPSYRFTISGNGKQVRDVLFSSDLVSCYFQAVENISKTQGQAFNIGGGMENSISLLELFSILEEEIDVKLNYDILPWRASDQKVFVANVSKAQKFFSWAPKVNSRDGIRKMVGWQMKQMNQINQKEINL